MSAPQPAAGAEGAEMSEEEAKQTVTEETFRKGMAVLMRYVLHGVKGSLHSVRSLRNKQFAKVEGDQDKAIARLSGKLEGTIRTGVTDELKAVALACVPGAGLPMALALPLWLRLRRVGVLCECYGHDAKEKEEAVVSCAFGVYAAGHGLDHALGLAWRVVCSGSVMRYLPVGSAVTALSDSEGKAAKAVEESFAAGRRGVERSEWDYPGAVDEVSVGGTVEAVGARAVEVFDRVAERGSEVAGRGLAKGTALASQAAAKGVEKGRQVAGAGLSAGMAYLKGKGRE